MDMMVLRSGLMIWAISGVGSAYRGLLEEHTCLGGAKETQVGESPSRDLQLRRSRNTFELPWWCRWSLQVCPRPWWVSSCYRCAQNSRNSSSPGKDSGERGLASLENDRLGLKPKYLSGPSKESLKHSHPIPFEPKWSVRRDKMRSWTTQPRVESGSLMWSGAFILSTIAVTPDLEIRHDVWYRGFLTMKRPPLLSLEAVAEMLQTPPWYIWLITAD
jgi:hypothetical protein